MKKWIVLNKVPVSSRYPFHDVSEVDYSLPNGSTINNHLHVRHPDWVNMIVIRNNEIAFIKQYRPGIDRNTYELPGGIVGADILESVSTELREELGLVAKSQPSFLCKVAVNPSTHTNYCHTFVYHDTEVVSEPQPEPTEDLEIMWVPSYDLIEFLVKSNVVASLSLAPLWKFIYQSSSAHRSWL